MPEALSTAEHPFKEWMAWDFIKDILRQEAIKWVKAGRIVTKTDLSLCKLEQNILNECWKFKEAWIINFFNINEEDLKNV